MNEADRGPTEHAKLNQFALRCFRDTGDSDYIAARLASRAHLMGPFLWSASQAVEKYLKCILFLHRIDTKDISHELDVALTRINSSLPFKIVLDEPEKKLFDHLVQWNSDRYLLTSFMVDSIELFQLDALVWKLRQYCVPLNKRHYSEEPSDAVLLERIDEVEAVLKGPSKQAGHLLGAELEKILAKVDHPAHNALTWKNMYYGRTERKTVNYWPWRYAVNAPLFLYPELANKAAQWMKISKGVKAAANRLAEQRSARKQGRKS